MDEKRLKQCDVRANTLYEQSTEPIVAQLQADVLELVAEVRRLRAVNRSAIRLVTDPTMRRDRVEIRQNGQIIGVIPDVSPEGAEPNPDVPKF